MPRTSQRARALQDIDTAIECLVYADVLAVSTSEDEEDEADVEDTEIFGDIESLLVVRASIARQHYYLPRNTSARRHHVDVLEAYIQEYPETAFLALFRMHRDSFWHIVQLLTEAGGEGYWDQ